MNTPIDAGPDGLETAASRVVEIDRLSRALRDRLSKMTTDVEDVTSANLNALTNKLDLLHAAHLRVVVAEDKFHDKTGTDQDADAIDYDAIRIEIGRQLNRIRDSFIAGDLSGVADAAAIADVALSLRILGDAAPDCSEG